MTPNTLSIWFLLVVSGVTLWRWRLHVKHRKALAELSATANERQEAIAEQVRELSRVNKAIVIELEETRRKLRETQGFIHSVCEQRDGWKAWYYRQASEHSSAQEYLAKAIDGLMAFIRKNESKIGRLPKLDPGFRAVMEEFSTTHPAAAERGEAAYTGAPPPGNLSPETTTNPQGSAP